ncbi:MAG TPA: allantoinase AllB [Opitutaceae bacterium]|nr:allantoinase AllB [Opitutaceae bacterium]
MREGLDLLIRGGTLVTPAGLVPGDLGVAGGRIARIAPRIAEEAAETLEAAGLHVFPGIIDAHVHFNEPGRTQWEGIETGSAALAAGGGVAFFDMPLNSLPPVLDAASFEAKRALAAAKSRTDFALWGGLVPGNLDRLGELRDAGAIALKAFLCGSGVEEFPGIVDPATLRRGMKAAAALGLLVAVHAEFDPLARSLTEAARARGETDARSWLRTRPVEVEERAILLATELAGETGCPLHIVHVSSPEGLALVRQARARGVDVSAETCPHYLLFSEEDVIRQGAPAKCAPPLRSEERRQGLWAALERGEADTIGSDHSPAPPEMKASPDFFEIWGGISGCQHGFPLLLSAALERGPAERVLPRLAGLLAGNVARRFRLGPRKGRLEEGADADLALLDLRAPHVLDNGELLYRHRQGPYGGRPCSVQVRRTLLRGRTIALNGRIASGPPTGQALRRS